MEEAAVGVDHNMHLFDAFIYVSAAMFWIGVLSFTLLVYKTYKKVHHLAKQVVGDIKEAVGEMLESLIQRYGTGWDLWIKCNPDGSFRIKEGCDRTYSAKPFK